MTTTTLAQSYLVKAVKRLPILQLLIDQDAYSDVVRESQEIVELALKGLLRQVGIEPPKQHDVSDLILSAMERFPEHQRQHLPRLAEDSKWLRRQREFAFYGESDFVPTEEYGIEDAKRSQEAATLAVAVCETLIPWPDNHRR
ncbi:MAG: HEPN domain-containing protein [Sulfobacillus sp.]